MYFIFNDTSVGKAKDIYLDATGNPVFASHLSQEVAGIKDIHGQDIPRSRRLVGKFESDFADSHRLTKDGELTKAGKEYCRLQGVQSDRTSLVKFISTVKSISVNPETVIQSATRDFV